MKLISGIYWDEGYINNSNDVLNNLLAINSQTDNVDEIRKIKNQINFIHVFLLTKDKIKKVIKTKDELESFIEMNEPILLGYYRKRWSDDKTENDIIFNVYLKRTYDLKFINVLFGIQIRSMAKHVMIKYFDYSDKNNIKIN
jgi:monomeric isocitrate dehydrogenase